MRGAPTSSERDSPGDIIIGCLIISVARPDLIRCLSPLARHDEISKHLYLAESGRVAVQVGECECPGRGI